MSNVNNTDRIRADRILYGELVGAREDLISNHENKFAYAFLRLTEIVSGNVLPIDEAHLEKSDDKLGYLKDVENVYASYFDLDYQWYKKDIGPFIGFVGENRDPVILRFKLGTYWILDPEDDKEYKVDKTKSEEFAGDGVYIIPKAGDRIKNGKQLLLRAAMRQKREFAAFFLLTLFGTLISAIIPSAAGYMTNTLIPNGEEGGIYVLAISLVMGVFGGLIINVCVNLTKLRVKIGVGHFVIATILGRILDMDAAHERRLSSRIISLLLQFSSSVDVILGSLMGGIVFLVQSLMVLRVTTTLDHDNNAIIYILVVGEVIFVSIMQYLVYKKTLQARGSDAKLSAMRREVLDNIEAIKTGGIEEKMYYRMAVAYDEKMRVFQSIEGINQLISMIGTLLSGIGLIIIFLNIAGAKLENTENVSAMVTSFTLIISYLNSMAASFAEVAGAAPHLKFADAILSAPMEKTETGAGEHFISGKIELKNVTFSYNEDSNPIIRGIDLTIEPGEYVGIVGTSGCGKSTLMRLMLGFLTPTDGYICYDGIELGKFNIKALRRQFGVVMQDAAVVTGSIRQNIGLSNDADMTLVTEAARDAAVLEDIEAMPMKFNTLLSSDAAMISGGQKQRIVLARALMRKPKILFLDEATSAVDNISQKIIKDNLDRMGITRISVAHRLSTIINCNRIIVMDKGEIAEQGTYEELMKKDGLFARMAKRSIL
ncbi:MAG: ATP-binding cassette domain-containing protein [Lachnospiraceae bacterium]|nr:ATP-binding cassette domain-containing protein [Lachnospiraceae bacterium]